ncbi:NAD(P)H-binding protein [Sorangium sp. So ce1078]|uniref:NAD(P)H-binding protein n=1 Tax=Sorangium sp. So ce1078 TaxID=3133329 RepID=UPI003F631901
MILVTGATGSVGRHVVDRLLAEGHTIRALTRNPGPARLPEAAAVVQGDLAEPRRLAPALDGVEAVYLMAMGGAPADFVDMARRAGVRRIVLLSTGDVLDDVERQPDAVAELHGAFERAIERSGLEWTFLRPNEFAGNSLHWAAQIKVGDAVRAPYGGACTAPIHERDIAAVAVRALVDAGHDGAKYLLTGPQAITHAEQVSLIGQAIGRTLRFEEISPEEARQAMTRYAPAAIVDAVLGQLAAAVVRPAEVTRVVEDVTGRPARSFFEWAIDHADDFR